MNTQEMIRKSGLIPPISAAALLERNANVATPMPEPPKPKPAAPQAQATPAPAAPTTTPAGAVDVVALEDLRQEIKKLIWQVLAAEPEKFRGVTGAKGDPGKDGKNVSASDLKLVITELIQEAINAQPERFRGKDGAPGKDSTVPGPAGAVGATGQRGERGATGEPGKTILVQTPKEGPQGIQGIQGIRGPAGLDEAAIEQIIVNVLVHTNVASELALKVAMTTMELESIAADPKYHRLGMVREEIVNRLKEKLT